MISTIGITNPTMSVRVVLVRPSYAGNVGSAVRIAANFACNEVVLVATPVVLSDPEFIRMAMGGENIVTVREVASLEEALQNTDLVIATTSSRFRDKRQMITPPELLELLSRHNPRQLALVFGPERSGLSKEELRLAHTRLTVPTNPDFPVLNLAQAVAIVLSGLRADWDLNHQPADPMDSVAPFADFDRAVNHLRDVLLQSGYLDPQNPNRVVDQLRRWWGRTVPTHRELALLHALAAHVTYMLGRAVKRSASDQ
jgi:TrmH family RNA methyltransferase